MEPLAARRDGHLVFVGSLSGKSAGPHSSLYSATKFGLRGFALSLRQDLAEHGVGVSLVSPGFVRDAGMFADSGARLPPGVGTSTPEDVAAAVVRAIEGDRAEVDVAPLPVRAGARLAGLAPGLSAGVQAGSARSRWRATSAQPSGTSASPCPPPSPARAAPPPCSRRPRAPSR